MKLGFVSAILADQDLDHVLGVASDEGFSCVELLCWPPGKAERRYAGVTHIDVTDLSDAAVSDIQGRVDKAGVEISALGYYPNYLVEDREEAGVYIDHFEKLMEASAKLDINTVTTFIGRDPSQTIDENWPRFLEVWKPLVKRAEDLGVRIAIENCPMLYTDDEWPGGKNLAYCPAVWERMFNDIPSDHFGLNYDPSHLVWQQIGYLAPIAEFREKLFHVHAKDVLVRHDRLDRVGIMGTPLQYHTPKLPGLGEVDFGKFFAWLSDAGYTGPVCIEVEDRAYEDTLESRYGALRQSARYLRNFMSEERADS